MDAKMVPVPVQKQRTLSYKLISFVTTGSEAYVTEEGIVPTVDARRGVAKTPTDEEEHELATKKREAFIQLAQTMSEQVEIEAAVPSSPGTKRSPSLPVITLYRES